MSTQRFTAGQPVTVNQPYTGPTDGVVRQDVGGPFVAVLINGYAREVLRSTVTGTTETPEKG